MVTLSDFDLRNCLLNSFKHQTFRPGQMRIVRGLLDGRDSFALMATGSGKSLCFQLPVIALRAKNISAVTIVVSPLISLMEDQVSSLAKVLF